MLTLLLPRLGRAHEREVELEMVLGRMMPSFLALDWNLEVAKQHDEPTDTTVHAIPDVTDSWHDDVQVSFATEGTTSSRASAINILKELLRKGSLALVAYRRHVTWLKCIELQEFINAAMYDVMSANDVITNLHLTFKAIGRSWCLEIGAHRLWVKRIELHDAAIEEVTLVNNVITDLHLAFEAKRAQLAASQLAKRQIAVQIVAMVCTLVTNHKSLACTVAVLNLLLPWLERAHEREAELEMALGRMVPSFLALNWSLMVAKQRDEYSVMPRSRYP
uniref:Uncharacterized protein n=1 Tax=Oryza nivara TaxID=4536 RepID=A0A0E0JAU6_ORYNI